MKQPAALKKGSTIKKHTAGDLMSQLGMTPVTNDNKEFSNADKPMDFYVMPEGFQDAIKLPGYPIGYISIITGWSNTGKSTNINCLIASAMSKGDFPVIYDTENSFDFSYAISCGMKATPVYGMVEKVNEETGEIYEEEGITDYEGDFLYFNTSKLLKLYGKINHKDGSQLKATRDVAVLEDIAYSMTDIIRRVKTGEFNRNILFIWDSIGSIGSYRSYESKVGNNMFDAGALSTAFNTIINQSIPTSRKLDSENTITMVCVNKIWDDSASTGGMGAGSFALKGGKSMTYAARLIIHLGGVIKAATKKLTAVAKGQQYSYGTLTKMKVTKNHLPTPYNVTYEGELACVHNGMCAVDKLDEYKKTHIKAILEKLEESTKGKFGAFDASEVSFEEVEVND